MNERCQQERVGRWARRAIYVLEELIDHLLVNLAALAHGTVPVVLLLAIREVTDGSVDEDLRIWTIVVAYSQRLSREEWRS